MSTEFIPPTPDPRIAELAGLAGAAVLEGIIGVAVGRIGRMAYEAGLGNSKIIPKVVIGLFWVTEVFDALIVLQEIFKGGDYPRALLVAAAMTGLAAGFFGFRSSVS